MKKNTLTLAFLLLFSAPGFLYAQINNEKNASGLVGNNEIVAIEKYVGEFSKLAVDYALKVNITEGPTSYVEIRGESNVIDFVSVRNSERELQISFPRDLSVNKVGAITVTIHQSNLNRISANTSCLITSSLILRGDTLRIVASEASNVTAPLAIDNLSLSFERASSGILTGKVRQASIMVREASRLTADSLTIGSGIVTADGASRANIAVTDELSVSVTSVSKVDFSGNPKISHQHVEGLSRLNKFD